MQLSTYLTILLAAVAVASPIAEPEPATDLKLCPNKKCQKLANAIPKCAKPCLDIAAKKSKCDPKNLTCLCKKAASITVEAALCVRLKCDGEEATTAARTAVCACLKTNPLVPCGL